MPFFVKDEAILGKTNKHLNCQAASFSAVLKCPSVETRQAERRPQQDGVWWSSSLQPLVQFTSQQLVVSGQKAGVETIWRVCFPPFPPALLCLKQLVWFHIYYFPCRKVTPTQNRIREAWQRQGQFNYRTKQHSLPQESWLQLSLLKLTLYKWYLVGLSSFSSDKKTSLLLLCCWPGIQISDIDGLK